MIICLTATTHVCHGGLFDRIGGWFHNRIFGEKTITFEGLTEVEGVKELENVPFEGLTEVEGVKELENVPVEEQIEKLNEKFKVLTAELNASIQDYKTPSRGKRWRNFWKNKWRSNPVMPYFRQSNRSFPQLCKYAQFCKFWNLKDSLKCERLSDYLQKSKAEYIKILDGLLKEIKTKWESSSFAENLVEKAKLLNNLSSIKSTIFPVGIENNQNNIFKKWKKKVTDDIQHLNQEHCSDLIANIIKEILKTSGSLFQKVKNYILRTMTTSSFVRVDFDKIIRSLKEEEIPPNSASSTSEENNAPIEIIEIEKEEKPETDLYFPETIQIEDDSTNEGEKEISVNSASSTSEGNNNPVELEEEEKISKKDLLNSTSAYLQFEEKKEEDEYLKKFGSWDWDDLIPEVKLKQDLTKFISDYLIFEEEEEEIPASNVFYFSEAIQTEDNSTNEVEEEDKYDEYLKKCKSCTNAIFEAIKNSSPNENIDEKISQIFSNVFEISKDSQRHPYHILHINSLNTTGDIYGDIYTETEVQTLWKKLIRKITEYHLNTNLDELFSQEITTDDDVKYDFSTTIEDNEPLSENEPKTNNVIVLPKNNPRDHITNGGGASSPPDTLNDENTMLTFEIERGEEISIATDTKEIAYSIAEILKIIPSSEESEGSEEGAEGTDSALSEKIAKDLIRLVEKIQAKKEAKIQENLFDNLFSETRQINKKQGSDEEYNNWVKQVKAEISSYLKEDDKQQKIKEQAKKQTKTDIDGEWAKDMVIASLTDLKRKNSNAIRKAINKADKKLFEKIATELLNNQFPQDSCGDLEIEL